MAIKDWNGFKKSGDTYIPNDATARAGVSATVDMMKDTTGWIGKNEVDVTKYNHISTNCVASGSGDVMTFTAPITATGQYAELSYYASQTSDVLFDHNEARKMKIIVTALTSNKAAIGVRNSENIFIKTLKFESTGTYVLDLSDVAEDYYVGAYPRWEYNNAEANMTFKLMVYDARLDDTYEPYHESVEEEIQDIYDFNAKTGVHQLLDNTAVSKTEDTVTFTVNADKTVDIITSATTTANANLKMTNPRMNSGNLPIGTYRASKKTTNANICMYVNAYNNTSYVKQLLFLDSNAEGLFTVDYNGYNFIEIGLTVPIGREIPTSTKAEPLVTYPEDKSNLITLPAMTNRELTEKIVEISKGTYSATFGNSSTFSFDITTPTGSIHSMFYAIVTGSESAEATFFVGYKVSDSVGNITKIGNGVATAVFDTTTGKFTITTGTNKYRTIFIITNAEIS